ncbi:MAG: hypothetical protein OXH63_01695, partial [Gemmatimonadetes bacterium]|nr:hypothetical protein [Gemmatimonadota bacterium]
MAITAIWIAAMSGISWGEVRQWKVGEDGESWASQELASTALDFSQAGTIKSLGFDLQNNITQQLSWISARPIGFLEERAQAHVWDNTTLRESQLVIVDGQDTTSTGDRFKEFGVQQSGRRFEFDLGTRIPINRILFFPRPFGVDDQGRPYSEDFIRGYSLFSSDGLSFTQDNRPDYSLLRQVEFTREDTAEVLFPLQFIRFIRLHVNSPNPFEIAEFQLFGTGFAPQASYTSKIIDLGDAANFSRLEWTVAGLRQEGTDQVVVEDSDTEIAIRMRTGTDDNPRVFFQLVDRFTREREVVTEDEYNKLSQNERGGFQDDQVNWSLWSSPFTSSGQRITLPSPRRYFQFEIAMKSQSILDGIQVSSLSVEHSIPPLAQQLIGEISVLDDPRPPRSVAVVPVGQFVTFTYDLIADVAGTDIGFDAIRIFTPSSQPKFGELFIGNPPEKVEPTEIIEELGSLTVLFPSSHRITGRDVLQIIFDAQVFVQGSFLNAEVFDTQSEEVPQRVLSGDANPDVTTNTLRVLTAAESAREVLSSFEVTPRVFSPNGDAINEEALIALTLSQLVVPVEVEVAIFDLAGRRVRTLAGEER